MTPDAIGLAVKREILQSAVHDNPGPEIFEAWLLDYIEKKESRHSPGAVSAMARTVLDEWRLAHSMNDFKAWLDSGAPSDDASAGAGNAASWMREKVTRVSLCPVKKFAVC